MGGVNKALVPLSRLIGEYCLVRPGGGKQKVVREYGEKGKGEKNLIREDGRRDECAGRRIYSIDNQRGTRAKYFETRRHGRIF